MSRGANRGIARAVACRSLRTPLALAVCALLLSACAMGPDYERPELPAAEAYVQPVDQGASIANLAWWELFEDPQLVSLIETALINNQDMRIAAARVEEARASLGFVRADQYPGVSGNAQASRGNQLGLIPGRTTEQYVLAANLDFEIDLWGKLRRATEASRAELLASEDAQNTVTITLIADVASAYLLLLDADQRVEIAKRTERTRNDSLGIIQARYDRGTVALIDLNQAQIELADAQAQLASVRRERGQAVNLLRLLIGQAPGPITRGSVALENIINAPAVPAGLPSELLERRPDVRRAEQLLAAQTARIGVAEALRFPSLSLTGTLGLASPELSDFFSSDNEVWSIGGSLFGPIFDAGRNRSRVEVERARTEQLLATYEQVVLQAFREVEDSLIAIDSFRAEAAARDRQVEAASSAAMLSRARYDGGVTSYLEVLESERSLFTAELQASSTRRLQLVSVVLLYKALGGGWPSAERVEAAGNYQDATLVQ